MKGRHQLSIKVDEEHVKGSPFGVAVKLPIVKLGTPILTIDGVKRPWGVAVTKKGEVVVTENHGSCISIFALSGQKLRSIGAPDQQFNSIRGVPLDGEGNILVADNHRLQKFTINGQFLKAVGPLGKGPSQFYAPQDIAYNASNNKVYVVDCNHHVQVLNSDLTYFSTFGKYGSGKGQFNYPRGIACDSNGRVYVTDDRNNRIQAFSAEGKFLKMFGRCGEGRGELKGPKGITFDTNDIMFVSECDNDRISVFTSEGQFMTSFGRCGNGPGEFKRPFGVVVDVNGVVYICDSDNNHIIIV